MYFLEAVCAYECRRPMELEMILLNLRNLMDEGATAPLYFLNAAKMSLALRDCKADTYIKDFEEGWLRKCGSSEFNTYLALRSVK